MTALRVDADQRFTCAGCARCCHSEVVITPGESAAYARTRVARWFRETDSAEEGAAKDPFEPLAGRPGWFRIRRRADGVCGFLSATNRCRIHEELGGDRKPLVCQLFPFSLHQTEGLEPLVVTSFCCPTTLANEGAPLTDQLPSLTSLRRAWLREFGDGTRPLAFATNAPMLPRALGTMRQTLRHMLDQRRPDGALDLRRNVQRMGLWLEDLARPRVVRLALDDFAEYAVVTGKHARAHPKELPARAPARLARLFARGFLFVAGVVESARQRPHETGLRVSVRWRLIRMLAHAHGLGPALTELDVRARHHARLDVEDPNVSALVHHYLRGSIETLGSGRRPVVNEIAFAVAVLNAGIALGAMHAVRSGQPRIGANALREGLISASYLTHVELRPLTSFLDTLTGGIEAFFLLAEALGPRIEF